MYTSFWILIRRKQLCFGIHKQARVTFLYLLHEFVCLWITGIDLNKIQKAFFMNLINACDFSVTNYIFFLAGNAGTDESIKR